MSRLIDRVLPARTEARSFPPAWLASQIQDALRYGGHTYLLNSQTYGPNEAPVLSGARDAILSNGTVYGIMRRRTDLFAQGEFAFRRYGRGMPTLADIVTSTALAPLQPSRPLLEQCDIDVAVTGASFWTVDGLRNLPAEYCTIVQTSDANPDDPAGMWDARPAGLIYQAPQQDPEVFLWAEIVAYIPERDPSARWRGMSWLRPCMEDVSADNGARRYLSRFFDNAATPNAAVVFPPEVLKETVEAFRDLFLQKHAGVERSFRTAFLGGGADLKVIGSTLKDLDSEAIRTQVHKDIAASAGVPIVAAGIEQGTYANSKEANRQLADSKIRYLWAVAAEAFAPAVLAPSGTELFVDTSRIAALQADATDDAQVLATQAQTMRTLLDGGYDPPSVTAAVTTGDLTKLVHSGNLSVQLIPAGQAPAQGGA